MGKIEWFNHDDRGGGGGGGGRSKGGNRATPYGGGGGGGNNSVFVSGLYQGCTWQELKTGFKDAGAVSRADVSENGKTGTVTYVNAKDAAWCVQNYNNTQFGGKSVKVKFDNQAKGGGGGGKGARNESKGAGVCYAFQEGNCTRGDDCRFSHSGGGGGGGKKAKGGKGSDVCYAFQEGKCTRGDDCRFSHSGGGGGGGGKGKKAKGGKGKGGRDDVKATPEDLDADMDSYWGKTKEGKEKVEAATKDNLDAEMDSYFDKSKEEAPAAAEEAAAPEAAAEAPAAEAPAAE
jgi:hypothetical protein